MTVAKIVVAIGLCIFHLVEYPIEFAHKADGFYGLCQEHL